MLSRVCQAAQEGAGVHRQTFSKVSAKVHFLCVCRYGAYLCDFSSGVRNKAKYRSLTDFTDNDLRSDYHFLTDVERVADTAHRDAYKAKLMLRPQVYLQFYFDTDRALLTLVAQRAQLPNHLKNLVRQALFRAVQILKKYCQCHNDFI